MGNALMKRSWWCDPLLDMAKMMYSGNASYFNVSEYTAFVKKTII